MRRAHRERKGRKDAEDIAERKTRELYQANRALVSLQDELLCTRNRLDFLFAASPAVTFSFALSNTSVASFMSANVSELLGFDASEFLHRPRLWQERVHADDTARLHAEYATLFAARKLSQEYRIRRKDGSHCWLGCVLQLVYDDKGAPSEVVGTWNDIGARKRTEAERDAARVALQRAKDRAEKATQAKSQFLASMTHELRTPLNAVIGVSEMLHEDAMEAGAEESIEPLERILGAGRHLLSVVNDILDLSKIEAGRVELSVTDFDVLAFGQDLMGTMQSMASDTSNTLVLECPEGITGMMRGDEVRLRQVLLNLLSNACKFTRNGRVTLSIALANSAEQEWIQLSVIDTGAGMDEARLDELFEEFTRATPVADARYSGTGLGLAISKKLCQLMGGDIGVESVPGTGSTFTVTIPRYVTG